MSKRTVASSIFYGLVLLIASIFGISALFTVLQWGSALIVLYAVLQTMYGYMRDEKRTIKRGLHLLILGIVALALSYIAPYLMGMI